MKGDTYVNITVVGSINIDLVYRVPHIVKKGETLHSTSSSTHFGGKGANQAVTSSQLGATVQFIGNVGEDAFGDQAVENLAKKGVTTDHIGRTGATGQAIIQLSQTGDNAIVLFQGANFHVTPEQIEKQSEALTSTDALLLQLEIPVNAVERAAEIAAQAGKVVVLNPAPARELSSALLQYVTILTPNETELHQLTGIEPVDDAELRRACDLLRQHGVQTVVVTLGARGAYYVSDEGAGWVDAIKAEVVDTTGAGDAFNGALAVAISRGETLRDAIQFANRVASFVVTQLGAQPELKVAF
ncbi:ribokinase [Chryseomicrobium palamuruense]|uniref:Ribokinase n=1 Tax=Chryseomicrobium palamuruense TaxID=682973 RepID=A0ABV8UTI4_9BACL